MKEMKKVRISIEENLRYQREMIIEVPDDMTEDKLNTILDKSQRRAQSAGDIPYIVESLNKDIKIVECPDEDLSSPWDSEIEIDDFDYID
jgi:hypothetical protein